MANGRVRYDLWAVEGASRLTVEEAIGEEGTMWWHRYDPEAQEGWKSHAVRIGCGRLAPTAAIGLLSSFRACPIVRLVRCFAS